MDSWILILIKGLESVITTIYFDAQNVPDLASRQTPDTICLQEESDILSPSLPFPFLFPHPSGSLRYQPVLALKLQWPHRQAT